MPLGLLRFTNALADTSDFIYPGPTIDMQSPAAASAVDGQTYKCYAQSLDMTEWEESTGVYTAASKTFARTSVTANSLGTAAKIDFTNPPQVFVFDTSASLAADLNPALALIGVGNFGQCRLVYVDATHVKLIPFNGDKIKIAGALYSIPAAGITLTNSGLPASTVHYIYATISAGSIILSAGTGGHTTSSTAGNVGVEIYSGNDALSLVGMIRTNGSSQFVDSTSQRFVRSWFNRERLGAEGALDVISTDSTTGSYVEKTVSKAEFICWASDLVEAFITGIITNSTLAAAVGTIIKIDSVDNGAQCDVNPGGINYRCPIAPTVHTKLGEGYHYVTFGLRALGGGTADTGYGMKTQARIG